MRDGKLQGKNVFNRQEIALDSKQVSRHMQKAWIWFRAWRKGSTREHIETQEFKKQTLEKEIDFLEKISLRKKMNWRHLAKRSILI